MMSQRLCGEAALDLCGGGGLGMEMGSPAWLLSDSTEKVFFRLPTRAPFCCQAHCFRGQALAGLTNVSLTSLPSLTTYRPVAGFC